MDTNKLYANQPDEDVNGLNLDWLYAAWKDDRSSVAPTALREWTAQYPAQATELARWTADAPVVAGEAELNGPEIDRAEQRLREIGRNMIAARRAKYAVSTTLPVLSDLYSAARTLGLTPRTLAAHLGMGLAIVAKLQQRLIRYSTVPAALIDGIALELQVSAQQVRDYLQQPASLATGASYKSNGVPQAAEQEDFAQALRSCTEMTGEQKAAWLSD